MTDLTDDARARLEAFSTTGRGYSNQLDLLSDLRTLLSALSTAEAELVDLRVALEEFCDAALSVDGHLTEPDDVAGWESPELYDAYILARASLESSRG